MSKRLYILLFFSFSILISLKNFCRNLPAIYTSPITEKTIYYKLGDRQLPITTRQYGDKNGLVFINLHSDEFTSVIATRQILEKEGGLLIKIENNGKRNIRFRLKNHTYSFDPNRIFSRNGILKTLQENGRVSNAAADEIEKFAARLLNLLPEKLAFVIALHNNTPGRFSAMDYLPGEEREVDAKKVYINPKADSDDLFLTTDSILFKKLAAEKFNIILQDNENAREDGSLSVYCGKRKIHYLNCETEHGKIQEYYSMMSAAISFMPRKDPAMLYYSFELENPGTDLSKNAEIRFGEKVVGYVKSAELNDAIDKITGELEVVKTFRLYTNMDFYLSDCAECETYVDIRIDPTRKREMMTPGINQSLVIKK
ncbi:MAG: hypothetical protein JSU05_07390 [Bacteroidetes bacterium]|nr:hypothetical protein [Bacteroidota bacterium]